VPPWYTAGLVRCCQEAGTALEGTPQCSFAVSSFTARLVLAIQVGRGTERARERRVKICAAATGTRQARYEMHPEQAGGDASRQAQAGWRRLRGGGCARMQNQRRSTRVALAVFMVGTVVRLSRYVFPGVRAVDRERGLGALVSALSAGCCRCSRCSRMPGAHAASRGDG